MNNERKLRKLQQKQAKARYREYKKSKIQWKKIVGFTGVAFIGVLIALVVFYQSKDNAQEVEEIEEQGNLKIENVGIDEGIQVSDESEEQEDLQVESEMSEEEVSAMVETYLASMNLEARVGQLFMITPEELTGVGIVVQAGETTQTKLKTYAVGGLLFGEQNFEVVDQMQLMLNSIEAYSSTPIFLAMDAEGSVRVTNTNNSLEEVGFDMTYDEELYLIHDGGYENISDSLNVLVVEDFSVNDVLAAVEEGAEILIVTDGFEQLYDGLVSAVREGTLDTEVLEERVQAILTYKVIHGM